MPIPGYSGEGDGGSELDWIIAGFRACALETLRFLMEQERLSSSDPIVLGLWRHLILQELAIDMDSVMSQQAAEDEAALPEPPDEAPSGVLEPQGVAARHMHDQEEQQSTGPQSNLSVVSPVVVPRVGTDSDSQQTHSNAELNTRERDF